VTPVGVIELAIRACSIATHEGDKFEQNKSNINVDYLRYKTVFSIF